MPVSKIRKSPIKAYSSSKSKVPVVILEKVNSSTRRSEGSSPKSQKSPVKLSPRRSNSIVNTTSTVSPKNLNNSVKKIIFESPSTRRSSKDSRLHLSPKVTLRRSLNLTGCFDESISVLRKKSSTPKYKSNRNRSGIENESEPDMSDTSLINMSDVFDSDVSQKEEKEKNKNGTYELDEPKTPGLRAKKAVKRSSSANTKGWEIVSFSFNHFKLNLFIYLRIYTDIQQEKNEPFRTKVLNLENYILQKYNINSIKKKK